MSIGINILLIDFPTILKLNDQNTPASLSPFKSIQVWYAILYNVVCVPSTLSRFSGASVTAFHMEIEAFHADGLVFHLMELRTHAKPQPN